MNDTHETVNPLVKDATEIFQHLASYHRHLHWQLKESRESRRPLTEYDRFNNCSVSSMMMCLRDVGKFALGIDPADDDGNPFYDDDDF